MQNSDFNKFQDGIVGAMGMYGKSLSAVSLDMWWTILKRFDLAAISDAFSRHLANPDGGKFPPLPAHIIQMLEGSTQDSSLRAWAKVDKAMREVGSYADVVFDDPLIHRVIHDMGGWIALGTKSDDEWPFIAKEFGNRYQGYRVRSERPSYPPKLMGLFTAHNQKGGYAIAPPVMIGNPDTALLVMQGGTGIPSVGVTRTDRDLKAVASLMQLPLKEAV